MELQNGMQLKLTGSDVKVIVTETDYPGITKVGDTDYLDRVMTPGIIEIVDAKSRTFKYINTRCIDVYFDKTDSRFKINETIHNTEGSIIYKLDTADRFPFAQSFENCFTSI